MFNKQILLRITVGNSEKNVYKCIYGLILALKESMKALLKHSA